jgi:phosphoribosylformylglycinamidine cyclo-ligase
MEEESHYASLGVSSKKEDIHTATENLDKGLFPGAFCKILPDYLVGDPNYCMVMHSDGTGTKSSLAYAYWKETGDLSVMRNIPIDAIVMNLDDVICVGATGPFVVDQTINRNKFNLPAEPLKAIIGGTEGYLTKLRQYGVEIYHSGGETADVGDVVQTFIIDNSIVIRMRRDEVIDCSNIGRGNYIVGISSYGPPASYEEHYNSGMGSNGLTAARHDLFSKYLAEKYPELWDSKNLKLSQVFTGEYGLSDKIEGEELTIGEMVLSPTRTYAPIVLDFLKKVNRSSVTGIIHCSGGGQTKCLKFAKNVHIVKHDLFPTPKIFKLIASAKKVGPKEMLQDFNMGHRMEVYCKDLDTVYAIITSAKKFNVDAQVIGTCDPFSGEKLTIHHEKEEYEFYP